MDRTLNVEVRDATWPPLGTLPTFPGTFHRGEASWDINIPSMLLMVGYLTTPVASAGVSLSEFWAWVRYLAAISNQTDMRITDSFSDLDAHQKTILSDDFGMGVPALWLSEKLSLDRILDGRYFMQRFGVASGATQPTSKKRGPNKTPDFVARDVTGVWHILECKGTQSSAAYAERQIGEYGPPASGGIAQKRSIVFPPTHTGQRLVSALQIGIERGESSRLIITDPEPEDPQVIKKEEMDAADDSATRAVAAKALRLAGFEATASVIASPTGRRPEISHFESKHYEKLREEEVKERDSKARSELNSIEQRVSMFDGHYVGREMNIQLPRPIFVGDTRIKSVTVQQGVKKSNLEEISEKPTITENITVTDLEWNKSIGLNKSHGEGLNANLTIGDFFKSEIHLRSD